MKLTLNCITSCPHKTFEITQHEFRKSCRFRLWVYPSYPDIDDVKVCDHMFTWLVTNTIYHYSLPGQQLLRAEAPSITWHCSFWTSVLPCYPKLWRCSAYRRSLGRMGTKPSCFHDGSCFRIGSRDHNHWEDHPYRQFLLEGRRRVMLPWHNSIKSGAVKTISTPLCGSKSVFLCSSRPDE